MNGILREEDGRKMIILVFQTKIKFFELYMKSRTRMNCEKIIIIKQTDCRNQNNRK